jgi:type IV pilus assembly protein PilB
MILEAEKATEDQLLEVYEEHERTGKEFVTVLLNYEIVTEQELYSLIAEELATDVVDLKELSPPEHIIERLSPSIARMYQVVPVAEEDGVLFLAAKDPLNYRMTDELPHVVNQECRIVVASPAQIDDALEHFYPEDVGSVHDVLRELQSDEELIEIDPDAEEGDDQYSLEDMANSAPIVRFVDVLLYQAIKSEASDIHFEPFADEFKVRYRIDGALYEMAPPPKHLALSVTSRIKVMSNLNVAERRKPQDGRIQLRIAGRPVDLRVSTLPTQYGESVVMRVLDRSVVELDIEKLGLDSEILTLMRSVIKRPNGIILVTGPTGSGKTTTLYSCLKELNDPDDKLLTAEDPVEYDVEGVIQVPVKDSIGMTFSRALRAFLRQDPDRIMVGEIRDLDTAAMAVQAALTGHLVLSTLHTNDAAGAVTRLVDMGVQPFLISSTICGVLAQRLVRRVCKECKVEYEPEEQELDMLGLTRSDVAGRKFCYGKGCETCKDTGYKGRVGIFEMLPITPEIQDLITERQPTSAIRDQAVQQGMVLLRQCGIRRILDGSTTVEEVLRYS